MEVGTCLNWTPPEREEDAYHTGDIVEYGGVLYRSMIDGNVWSPSVRPAAWEACET